MVLPLLKSQVPTVALRGKSMETNPRNETRRILIGDICDMEWEMFDKVQNRGGRACCQNDAAFFRRMRACQFETWNNEMLQSYRFDLREARKEGRNLLMEKYAFMMESTNPEEFLVMKDSLPRISREKAVLIRDIVSIQVEWEREVDRVYPHVRAGGRPLTSDRDGSEVTSFETYLTGELKTYSEETLRHYAEYVHRLKDAGLNLARFTAERTALAYGYASLEEAEQKIRMHDERFVR